MNGTAQESQLLKSILCFSLTSEGGKSFLCRQECKQLYQTGMAVFEQGGGPQNDLSPTYNAALSTIPRQLNNHSHLGSSSPRNPDEGWLGKYANNNNLTTLKLRAYMCP